MRKGTANMTIEEYSELAKTASAETFPAVITSILDGLKVDLASIDALNAQIGEMDVKIRDLQDTNHKLFLSQTSTPEKDKEDPADGLEGIKALDAMSVAIKDAHKDKAGIDLLSH